MIMVIVEPFRSVLCHIYVTFGALMAAAVCLPFYKFDQKNEGEQATGYRKCLLGTSVFRIGYAERAFFWPVSASLAAWLPGEGVLCIRPRLPDIQILQHLGFGILRGLLSWKRTMVRFMLFLSGMPLFILKFPRHFAG